MRHRLPALVLLLVGLALGAALAPRPALGGAFAPAPRAISACAYRTTNFTMGTTAAQLTFDSELIDANNIHSSGTMTVPSGGAWRFTVTAGGGGTSYYHYFELYKNGSAITGCMNERYGSHAVGDWVVNLAANDAITVYTRVSTGTPTLFSSGTGGNGGYATFTAVKL